MKKWSLITAIVMSLIVLTTGPLAALAQDDEAVTAGSGTWYRDGLAIVAPLAAKVDTRISITVFQCSDQEPVAGAGVWLITRENMATLKQEMSSINGDVALDTDSGEYEHLLGIHGTFLDETDREGKVWHSFDSAGRYLLVAVKRGYLPDSRPIAAGTLYRALAIDAPKRAEVEENVTIIVYQRGTEDPVKDAGVWAFTREDAESLKADMAGIRESGDQDAIDVAMESACDVYGIFLGTTNGAGTVKHAFEDAGGYLLVSVKRGYFPGFRPIAIIPKPELRAAEKPAATDAAPGIRPNIQ